MQNNDLMAMLYPKGRPAQLDEWFKSYKSLKSEPSNGVWLLCKPTPATNPEIQAWDRKIAEKMGRKA